MFQDFLSSYQTGIRFVTSAVVTNVSIKFDHEIRRESGSEARPRSCCYSAHNVDQLELGTIFGKYSFRLRKSRILGTLS